TVCSHVMLTTLDAADVAARLRAEGVEIELEKVVAAAAVHDLAEAVLGHPAKLVRERVDWEGLEEEVFKRHFPHLLEVFRWYRHEVNYVGRVVAFADKLATLVRACRYRQLGYPTDDLAKNLYKRLLDYHDLSHVLEDYVATYCGGVLP
ncbi:MAG: HD domain-containing protein, partial [Pyrobaculum sp.]